MDTDYAIRSLPQYVFDSSSLINIERGGLIEQLRKRYREVILPEKVSEEVKTPGYPLERFVDSYPSVVALFTPSEEERYLEIRRQVGIHDGEAAAMALALSRRLPLVVDESAKRAKGKAENHDIPCLTSQEFLHGALSLHLDI